MHTAQAVTNYAGPAGIGTLMIIGAFAFWWHNHWQFMQWILFLGGAFFLTLGATAWLDALIGLTYAGPGLVILFALVTIGTYSLFMQLFRRGGGKARFGKSRPRSRHGKYRTAFICMVMGTAFAVALVSWRSMVHNSKQSLVNTGQAIAGQVSQVSNGHALKVAKHSGGSHLVWYVVAIVVVVLLVIKFAERDRRRGDDDTGGGRGQRGGRGAVPGGAAAAAVAAAGVSQPRSWTTAVAAAVVAGAVAGVGGGRR